MTAPPLLRGQPPERSPWSKHRHRWVLEPVDLSPPRPTPDPATEAVVGTCDCGGTREFRGSAEGDWRSWRVTSRLPEQPVRKLIRGLLLDSWFVRLHLAAFGVAGVALAVGGGLTAGGRAFGGFVAWGAVLAANLGILFLRSLVSGSPESHPPVPSEGGIVMTGSISSTVKLDYDRGTAEKIYLPTRFVTLLYRLSFQGPFPYTDNAPALEAARLRRTIAGLLTKAWFGENMVAQALDVRREEDGRYTLVTELIRGTEPKDPRHAKLMLRQLTARFLDAGLASWQVGHYNPRAIGNLIEREDGSYRIIDLESNLVTPIMPKGAALRAIRGAQYPSFDDADMPRLEQYLATNHEELMTVLGPEDTARLIDAAATYGQEQRAWHGGEPRIPGKLMRLALALVDVPRWVDVARSRRGVSR